MSERDLWSAFHFSCSSTAEDTPGLLRKVAQHLDEIGPVQVADMTFRLVPDHTETDHRSEMTVYYVRPDPVEPHQI